MSYRSKTISSKWTKTKWLLQSSELRGHVPATVLFNKRNLAAMLSSYSTVYCKPVYGSGGVGIIRIKRQARGYRTQQGGVVANSDTMDRLFGKLNRMTRGRSYLLQKGIALSKTNGRPFDIRVMVQKTNAGKWVSTALITKIGRPGKVATNYNQGGDLGYFRPTMSGAGFGSAFIRKTESKLKRMGVSAGRCFDRRAKGFRELGLDVALDSAGRPWVLEVNTRPQFYPLKNMRDRGLYRRIVSHARQYGRSR